MTDEFLVVSNGEVIFQSEVIAQKLWKMTTSICILVKVFFIASDIYDTVFNIQY